MSTTLCIIGPIKVFSSAFRSHFRLHLLMESIRAPFNENLSWEACITPIHVLPDSPLQYWLTSFQPARVVQGINLISLVWTDGDCCLPCDYRLYHKAVDGLDKNQHFRDMLQTAQQRGFAPAMVAFDGWYSSLENLKLLRTLDWHWLTRLKANRQVSLRPGLHQAVSELDFPASGLEVHLRGYGLARVFRTVDLNGNAQHWATDLLDLSESSRQAYADRAWRIEEYHRSLKQFTGVARAQFRLEIAQRNHIGLALRAFVRLELHRTFTLVSHYHSKLSIVHDAIRPFRAHPVLFPFPTA